MNLMRLTTRIGTACIWAAILGSAPAAAREESGSLLDYAGALIGPSFFNLGGGVHPSFGLEAGTQVLAQTGVGGFISYAPSSDSNSGDSSGTYTFAVVGNYFLDQLLAGSRIGLKTGIAHSSDSTQIVLGPLAAYDYSLGNGFSVGGEASLLFATSQPLGESLNLLFTAHYWF